MNIDTEKTQGQGFAQRSRALLEQMQGAGLSRLPGERRHRERAIAAQAGVALRADELAQLRQL